MTVEKESCGYDLRDHTADIALHVWADSLESLFIHAAHGLYAAIGELKPDTGERRDERLQFQAADVEGLLHDFLSELLFRFETRNEHLSDFNVVERSDTKMILSATVAPIDPRISTLDREVKAVTYHELNITRQGDRCAVAIILDI